MDTAARWVAFGVLMVLMPRVATGQVNCAHFKEELHLEGQLQNEVIQVFLTRMEEPTDVYGISINPSTWRRPGRDVGLSERVLNGSVSSDCELRLEESNGSNDIATAHWELKFVNANRLQGTRRTTNAAQSSPVLLRIAAPVDCSGRGEWVRFKAKDWPFTFAYPKNWRLWSEGNRSELWLGCPSPERLAHGGAWMAVSHGSGRAEVELDSGRTATDIEGFRNFGTEAWLYGGENCEGEGHDSSVSCTKARQSSHYGMKVLQASAGEHRLYAPGRGYIGQGGGIVDYLFMHRDHWMLVKSSVSEVDGDVDGSEPVLMEGRGVGERLVRSVRPKP